MAGLRESCPPALPVVVRASWLPKTILGQCFRREKRFVVLLRDQMRQAQAVEVLCHEWAHALAWIRVFAEAGLVQLMAVRVLEPWLALGRPRDKRSGNIYDKIRALYLSAR